MRRVHALYEVLAVIPVVLVLGVAACGPSEDGSAAQELAPAAQAKPGKVIRVPQDQPTIAAAMAAAGPGDTVRLAPGTFRETLALKAGVKVVGGPSTIDATGLDNGMAADPSVKDASVSGIAVENATLQGINLDGAEVRLRQVAARNSGAAGYAGLLAGNGARLSLIECELSGNGGRGLNANFSDVSVEASRILDNGAAGIGMEGSTVRISNTLLSGNGGAGNVRVSQGSRASLEQDQIVGGNGGVVVDSGGDPASFAPSTATLEQSQISLSPRHGVAVLDGSAATVSGCVVQGSGVYGVLVTHGSSARLEGNRISGSGDIGLRVDAGDDLSDQRRSTVHSERNVVTGSAAGLQIFNSDVWSEGDAFEGNSFAGAIASFGATLQASAGSLSGNGSGLWSTDVPFLTFCADPDCTSFLTPQATVHVSLDGMQVNDNGGIGVVAQPGGVVAVRRSAILRNRDNGLFGNSGAEDVPGSMVVRQTRIEGNAGWCAIASGDYAIDLGTEAGGFNTCVGNGNAGGVANTTTSQAPIPAEGNWWGTADDAAIATMMYGPVDFVPFLTAAP